MTRDLVTSSRIAAIGYDSVAHVLEVEFKPSRDGRRSVWAFDEVAPDEAEALFAAPSIGSAFTAIQRDKHGYRVATIDADGIEHSEVDA